MEVMPELLGLDMFTKNGFLRFFFPSAEVPHGSRIPYKGDDAVDLMKEFLIKKRGKAVGAASHQELVIPWM